MPSLVDGSMVKVQTFCPVSAVDAVRLAIGKAGGGQIGNYSHCAFVSSGFGYFLPLDGADPYIGEKGTIERVEEVKIEFLCARNLVEDVVKAI